MKATTVLVLPCPFCGAKARRPTPFLGASKIKHKLACYFSRHSVPATHYLFGGDDNLSRWNRRANGKDGEG